MSQEDIKKMKEKNFFKEISKREKMAKKAARLGGFEIVEFLNLKNLQLNSYPHNYLTNIIVKYFNKI